VDDTTGQAISFTGDQVKFIQYLRVHVEGTSSAIMNIAGNTTHDDVADFQFTWDGYDLFPDGFAPICGHPGEVLLTVKAPDSSNTINVSVMALG
jgi:hypothetical protein